MIPWLLSISFAYLVGSIPFGYLLVRAFRHQDIRASGSGNIGATNVARSGAKGLAIATLLLDPGKGSLAVVAAFLIARHSGIFARQPVVLAREHAFDFAVAAAVAAVVGHMFPLWLRFRGGKGVATALGVFLALNPLLALVLLLLFAGVFSITRFVSLASILASAAAPVLAILMLRGVDRFALLGFCAIALLVIVKHHGNIARLRAGTESRFGARKAGSKNSGAAI